MTTTFRDFLQKRAEEEKHPQRKQMREEWVTALRRLLERIRSWLTESDPDRVLDVYGLELERAETGLGVYLAPGLKIGIGDASVIVEPIGRLAVGLVHPHGEGESPAEGRVDIKAGVRRYIIYRTLKDGQEKWYALDEHFDARPLDRERLEEILVDLLS
jgi:hypothetical protein